jgi:hypothetical protein
MTFEQRPKTPWRRHENYFNGGLLAPFAFLGAGE